MFTRITVCLTGAGVMLVLPVLLLVHMQPVHFDAVLDDMLRESLACDAPCFLGIEVGVSSVGDALDILRDHTWVGDVTMFAPGNGFSTVQWDWSGTQPGWIDSTIPGQITFYWENIDIIYERPELAPVDTLAFQTHVRLYELQQRLGLPDSGTMNHYSGYDIRYSAAYHQLRGMLVISTIMECPVSWMTYAGAAARIQFSIAHGSGAFMPVQEMIAQC